MPVQFPPACRRTYRPVRPIAEGGFGTVWLAEHEALRRPVAIKVLHAFDDDDVGTPDDDATGRFRDEARIAATLSHPSIVKVLDHGVDEALPWIAFEYVDGPALGKLIATGPLPVAEVLEVGRQIAGALAVAHAAGVLHRDVKPDNIMRAPDGSYKLTDFGIARWKHGSAALTAPGVVLGSPSYIAPERIAGETQTASADLYALGVTLFELLTGQPPFAAEDTLELFRLTVQAEAPRASTQRHGVPRELDDLIARLLEKSPARRPASATELERALCAISAARGERRGVRSSAVRPPGWRTAALRRAASPLGLAAALALVLLALVGGPALRRGATTTAGPRPAPSRAPAVMAAFREAATAFRQAAFRRNDLEQHLPRPPFPPGSAPPAATTTAPLDPGLRTRFQLELTLALDDAARLDAIAAQSEQHMGVRDGDNSAAGLRSRSLAHALIARVQARRLRRALDDLPPNETARPEDPEVSRSIEALMRPLLHDLRRLAADGEPGQGELGRLLLDVLRLAKCLHADGPLAPDAARAAKSLRRSLDWLGEPHGKHVAAAVRALWLYGVAREPRDGPLDEAWNAVVVLREHVPAVAEDLFAGELWQVLGGVTDREARHDTALDASRRQWLVDGRLPHQLDRRVKADLELAGALVRCFDATPRVSPGLRAQLDAMHAHALGVQLRLYSNLDRVTRLHELGKSVQRLDNSFLTDASELGQKTRPLRPRRAPELARYLAALTKCLRGMAAGGPPRELLALCAGLMNVARRARASEIQAGDPLSRAVAEFRARLRGLPGEHGPAIAAIVDAYWELGFQRDGEPLRAALLAHFDQLERRLPDPGGDLGMLWRQSREILTYSRVAVTLPERVAPASPAPSPGPASASPAAR